MNTPDRWGSPCICQGTWLSLMFIWEAGGMWALPGEELCSTCAPWKNWTIFLFKFSITEFALTLAQLFLMLSGNSFPVLWLPYSFPCFFAPLKEAYICSSPSFAQSWGVKNTGAGGLRLGVRPWVTGGYNLRYILYGGSRTQRFSCSNSNEEPWRTFEGLDTMLCPAPAPWFIYLSLILSPYYTRLLRANLGLFHHCILIRRGF